MGIEISLALLYTLKLLGRDFSNQFYCVNLLLCLVGDKFKHPGFQDNEKSLTSSLLLMNSLLFNIALILRFKTIMI